MPTNKDLKQRVRSRMAATGEPYAVARAVVAAPDVDHPSPEITQRVVNKVVARRGRLHAYPSIDPARTVLVVVDLDEATGAGCRAMDRLSSNVNAIAEALRERGGRVAWVLSGPMARPDGMAARVGVRSSRLSFDQRAPGGPGTRLWPGLDARDGDLRTSKQGASAFFPGRCDLPDQLADLDVRSVLVAGAVTNVCCESTARDACELGYEVTMVSDACEGHAFGLHEATLTTFFRIFGDVRPTADLLQLIAAGRAAR